MDHLKTFSEIFRQPDAVSVAHDKARELLAQGASWQELIDSLEMLRASLRAADDEATEDRVMELMDCFYGWCATEWDLRPK